MYSAKDIAELVINWYNDRNLPITNLRLQKLLYFLQGEFLKERNTRLIREDFYAWQLGPVIPSVYSEYAIYSSIQIPRIANLSINIPDDVRSVIDRILQNMLEDLLGIWYILHIYKTHGSIISRFSETNL